MSDTLTAYDRWTVAVAAMKPHDLIVEAIAGNFGPHAAHYAHTAVSELAADEFGDDVDRRVIARMVDMARDDAAETLTIAVTVTRAGDTWRAETEHTAREWTTDNARPATLASLQAVAAALDLGTERTGIRLVQLVSSGGGRWVFAVELHAPQVLPYDGLTVKSQGAGA